MNWRFWKHTLDNRVEPDPSFSDPTLLQWVEMSGFDLEKMRLYLRGSNGQRYYLVMHEVEEADD